MIHELRFKEEKKFKLNENGITFFSLTERKKKKKCYVLLPYIIRNEEKKYT